MDSAEASTLQGLFASNNARMDRQDEQMLATGHAVQALVAQVSELTTQLQLLRTPTAPPPLPIPPIPADNAHQHEPRLPTPAMYGGEPDLCRAFLTKCSMFFSLQPLTFATVEAKVALVLTLLTGEAALWGTAVWENQHLCCSSFNALKEEMRRIFDRAATGREAARRLADLQQGERTVSCYSIEFRTLAAESKWNEAAQWDMFQHGLADRIQRETFMLELPPDLDGLIDLALRVDSRLQQGGQRSRHLRDFALPEYSPTNSDDAISHPPGGEPMQVGRARLSREEREHRRRRGLCIYCGTAGHFLAECPVKGQARQRI